MEAISLIAKRFGTIRVVPLVPWFAVHATDRLFARDLPEVDEGDPITHIFDKVIYPQPSLLQFGVAPTHERLKAKKDITRED